ncbi:MAG: beta-galactosidase [Pseudomonadota bacterium]
MGTAQSMRAGMFGVCYYPEHWPRERWPEDAAAMADLGLRYVRIGEFAWSRLEPEPGRLEFDWLDDAIDTLAAAGLKVVLGTPTATPPKWLVDRYPEVLPVDPETGRVRGFGSRRHYDFSSERYADEALRITRAMAERYGRHDAVAGWQTDNELGCHDTTVSISPAAIAAFRRWCIDRYRSIDALNEAWGNVFWSMEYRDFDEIEAPYLAVTETNPAHRLAYRRFASDQVIAFHDRMIEAIRKHSPGRFVMHNLIPFADTNVDNAALTRKLDFASYDSYPLGRTDVLFADESTAFLRRYMRTGHPDLNSYSLAQTRSVSNSGFWIMEQQPGSVNWAGNNPIPAPGMIRFWTLEAFAHGADCVSYFRWRQLPFAQEQMHAGLLRVDGERGAAWAEVEQAIAEVEELGVADRPQPQASVAIVTDPDGPRVADIERQSEFFDYERQQQAFYIALRKHGVNIDFVSPDDDLDGYRLVIAPCLPIVSDAFVERVDKSDARFLFGPRSGAKTDEFRVPDTLAPGKLARLIGARVLAVDTTRPDVTEPLRWNGRSYASHTWRERLELDDATPLATFEDDTAAGIQNGSVMYLATLTDDAFLDDFLGQQLRDAGIETLAVDEDVRIVRRDDLVFAFNYSSQSRTLPVDEAAVVLGDREIGPHDVTVWRR